MSHTPEPWEAKFDSAIRWAGEPNKSYLKALKASYRECVEALKTLLPLVEILPEVPDVKVQQARAALPHAEGQP